ncbi:hypothetical protein JOB18_000732 [Solea senegalensis]|uniref:L1 transposable element RRM domain-containing protein n=1 Tax=Solea senegalensis TaxID=28829 RepID=A0AAV6RFC5_SOLSE|nr:hypothetical protein JOB18_000732 [Solea senegalensis]
MQKAFKDFKANLRKDVRDELTTFKQDVNQKLAETTSTLQAQGEAISGAEARISELEASGPVAKDALLLLLNQHNKMQEKLIDLENRSRRYNMRLDGIPENTEGTSMVEFINNMLVTELNLSDGVNLEIQRAQRASVSKPNPNAPPRSVIVNFLRFEIEEMVLKSVWKKKVCVGENLLLKHVHVSICVHTPRVPPGSHVSMMAFSHTHACEVIFQS